jgi:hypothetical protein
VAETATPPLDWQRSSFTLRGATRGIAPFSTRYGTCLASLVQPADEGGDMSTMEDRMSRVEQTLAEIAEINRRIQEIDLQMREANREREREREELERTREEARNREREARNREWEARKREWEEKDRVMLEKMEAQTVAFREERREAQRKWDEAQRKWGELANKMGTLVEDIVAPSLPTVFRSVFGLERLDSFGQRINRTHRTDPGRQREFDYVASAADILMVNETKSTVKPDDIPAFVAVLEEARDYLPEADGKAVVGALAAFSVHPSLVVAGERQGLLMFGLGTGLLRVLNTPGFQPRRF